MEQHHVHELGAAAPDQLMLTITPDGAYLEATEGHLPFARHDARDTEGLLATIGRWLFDARRRQGCAQ